MTREELTAARGYVRQMIFLALAGKPTMAISLYYENVLRDTDITDEARSIIEAIIDGINDYTE